MSLEIFKQQGLDLFKRFEIAIPQKKTEKVLQIGNETKYKTILSSPDSKYLVCCAYGEPATIHIREIPSGKCLLEHRFDSFFNRISEISEYGIAILIMESRQNLFVKFPEGEIVKAISGFLYDPRLCGNRKSFLIQIDDDYYLYHSAEDIIHFDNHGKKIREVHISQCVNYALVCFEKEIEVIYLPEGKTLYTVKEELKIFDTSIGLDSCYFVYSARNSSKDGYLKTIDIQTGKQVDRYYAVLYQPEFLPFSKGWVFMADQIILYYPEIRLVKEIPADYLSNTIVETNENKYLLLIKSYRDKDYVDWNRFEVFDTDNIYDKIGAPMPLKRVDYQSRFSEILVSPDKKMCAVSFPGKAIEFYSTNDFSTIFKIELFSNSSPVLCFSACSRYFAFTDQEQFYIYDTTNFELTNKPLPTIRYLHHNSQAGLYALVDSVNSIQVRRVTDGKIIFNLPPDKNTPYILILKQDKIWSQKYIKNYYCPEVIELNTGKREQFEFTAQNIKLVDNQFFVSQAGIINIETCEIAASPHIVSVYDNSYFYSFPKYSVKVNRNNIKVFENTTGILIKEFFPPVSKRFGISLVICGEHLIYELENQNEIYIEKLTETHVPVLLKPDNHSYRDIGKVDENNVLIRTFHVGSNTSFIYVYNIDSPEKPINQFVCEGNLYKIIVDERNQRIMLNDYRICWFIDLKNPELVFSVRMEKLLGSFIYEDFLIMASENNKVNYYNLNKKSNFKYGELLATLFTLPGGFLWTVPGDPISPEGWFWTENPEYIEVMQYINKKQDYELLLHDSPERLKYIELHNREDLITARLHKPDKYFETIADLQNKKQINQLQQFKHLLMLDK